MLPISSRKSVPPSACSNFPTWSVWASVNAPLTWPKSSLSKRVSVRAPASTHTIGLSARSDNLWISPASTSFPVPFSPVMRTVASVGAIFSAVFLMTDIAGPLPHKIVAPEGGTDDAFFTSLLMLLYAPLRVSTSLSLSQGLTMKSNAPRFIPSTARAMSAYAVNRTTSMSGQRFLISESQYSPSLPVFMSVWKFMSRRTTSGRNSASLLTSSLGDGISSTCEKCSGRSSFNAALIPLLSSTTNIFPLLFAIALLLSLQI